MRLLDEKELLIRDIMKYHSLVENPDFEEQMREVLENYIVFRKDRLPYEEIERNSKSC